MPRSIAVAGALVAVLSLGSTPLARAQEGRDDGSARREYSDRQKQIEKALERLENTMRVLSARLEAEGRMHAVELLKSALERLEARDTASKQGLPLKERMTEAEKALRDGEFVRAAESQETLLKDLEDLLAILL